MTRPQLIAWLMAQAEPWQAIYMEMGAATTEGANALQQFTNYVNAAEMLADDAFRLQHLNEALLNAR